LDAKVRNELLWSTIAGVVIAEHRLFV